VSRSGGVWWVERGREGSTRSRKSCPHQREGEILQISTRKVRRKRGDMMEARKGRGEQERWCRAWMLQGFGST
jgi:hypothetical protein